MDSQKSKSHARPNSQPDSDLPDDENVSGEGIVEFLAAVPNEGIALMVLLGIVCPSVFLGFFWFAGYAEGLNTTNKFLPMYRNVAIFEIRKCRVP